MYHYYNALIVKRCFTNVNWLERKMNIPLNEISDDAQSQRLDGHTDFHRKRASGKQNHEKIQGRTYDELK